MAVKDLMQGVLGLEFPAVPQVLHPGKIGKGPFRAEIDDGLRALQAA
jgi:hypothetical protein